MGLILDCNPGDLVMYRERVDAPWSAARVYAVGHSGDAAQPWTTLLTLTLLDESGAATGETRFVNDTEFADRVRRATEDLAFSELLATLKTATGGGLDCIGALFKLRRSATLDLDFASTEWDSTGSPGIWRDVEPDADYRKRIVTVVEEAAARMASEPVRHVTVMLDDRARVLDVNGLASGERVEIDASGVMTLVRGEAGAPSDDNARINASACLHRAVKHAMVALYARCDLIPATAAGYEMIRNEIACALGDLRSGAVNVEPQPPGFYVTWNGVDCTWLGMRTTAKPTQVCHFCERSGPLTEYTMHAVSLSGIERMERFYACNELSCPAAAHNRCDNSRIEYESRQAAHRKMAESSTNALALRSAFLPPPRPDGFAQSAVDAAKAVLLATVAKRGAK